MDSRKRNRLVSITRQASGQSTTGQPNGAWAEVASVWANVAYLRGLESIKAGGEMSVSKASIRIGYRTDVTSADRVTLGTTVFEIKAVLPDEQRKEYTDLACEVLA